MRQEGELVLPASAKLTRGGGQQPEDKTRKELGRYLEGRNNPL